MYSTALYHWRQFISACAKAVEAFVLLNYAELRVVTTDVTKCRFRDVRRSLCRLPCIMRRICGAASGRLRWTLDSFVTRLSVACDL